MTLQSVVVNNRYIIGEKLGSGSFGTIYSAVDNQTNNKVALKLESSKSDHLQLNAEKTIYKKLQGSVGIPQIYDC